MRAVFLEVPRSEEMKKQKKDKKGEKGRKDQNGC